MFFFSQQTIISGCIGQATPAQTVEDDTFNLSCIPPGRIYPFSVFKFLVIMSLSKFTFLQKLHVVASRLKTDTIYLPALVAKAEIM